MFETRINITKELILSRISEEEIFEKYLDIEPNLTDFFVNPLRFDDDDPGCRFYRDSRNVLKFNDFAGEQNIDCFNVVQLTHIDNKTGKNVNYYQALEIIARDFGISDKKADYSYDINIEYKPKQAVQKTKFKIDIKILVDWTRVDREYWSSHCLAGKDLKFFKTVPVQRYWLNGKLNMYEYSMQDPCYCYIFPTGKKLYFPFRRKGEVRFLHDTKYLQGYEQLPEFGDLLVITKSYKDVMCLRKFGIYAIAPMSETYLLSDEQFTDLYNRFDNIIMLFDFDRAGIRQTQKYKRVFELPYLFFTDGTRSTIDFTVKDFAAYVRKFGPDKTLKLIKETKDYYGL